MGKHEAQAPVVRKHTRVEPLTWVLLLAAGVAVMTSYPVQAVAVLVALAGLTQLTMWAVSR